MLEACFILYVHVTGPYWWLVSTGKVSYLELSPVMKELELNLQRSTTCPELLEGEHWLNFDNMDIPHMMKFSSLVQHIQKTTLLWTLLKQMAQSMLRTV
ncbi:hypothetical protein DPMN_193944 [Dreissena polymorpha]|uniref:Uncharacterized protein n=1 Tax=Dreissena polymorpha TaxID=45954 RepID=A0A9D4BEH1_DREPO|nr:hypothetical protein DPMN_193944 [Dreissena polymorpha]